MWIILYDYMCFISNKMPQKNFGQPNATGGVYSNPPDPLAGGKGEGGRCITGEP